MWRPSRFETWLLAITGAALLLRVAVAWHFRDLGAVGYGDQEDYRTLAHNLRHYGTLGTAGPGGPGSARRMPGYPTLVAATLELPGSDRFAVACVQALLGAITVGLTGLLGRRIGGPTVGLLGALLVAAWPSQVLFTPLFLSETLFTTLLVGALAVLHWRLPGQQRALAGGLLLGAACLVRPAALPVVIVSVAGALARRDRRTAAVVAIGAAALMMPWVARNAITMRALVVTDTSGGFTLCQGNSDGAGPSEPTRPDCLHRPGEGEVAVNRRLTSAALSWMTRHPGQEAKLIAQRAWFLMSSDGDAALEYSTPGQTGIDPATVDGWRRLCDAWWRVLVIPGLTGVVLVALDRRWRWLVAAWLSVLVLPLLATVVNRYHQPLVPLLAIGTAMLADRTLRRAHAMSRGPRGSASPATA